MNYKHLYHAGNFCDVFKHVALISLISFLKRKDKPFCYIETHAGRGIYNLLSEDAQKTLEYKNGVEKIIEHAPQFSQFFEFEKESGVNQTLPIKPEFIQDYIKIVEAQGFPKYYPGSPLIAASELRSEDRMILMELHVDEAKALKKLFEGHKQVAVHNQDGYQGLKAFLPPKEHRALILIDPPYEKNSEWADIIQILEMAYKRFSSGIYAIWYPLKDKKTVLRFHQALKECSINSSDITIAEISLYPQDIITGLIGCGMVIINPPWKWSESFSRILPRIWKSLSVHGQGSYRVYSLADLST